MRVVRWLAVLLVVVLLVAVAAVAYVSLTFDPNDHRGRVVDVVKERTGRDLVIGKPISLTYFPWFGIRLQDVSLKNPAGFGDEPFARFDELSLRINLVPLMDGHLVVDTIALDGAMVDLRRLKDGKDNWSDLAPREEAPEDGAPQASTDQGGETAEGWIRDYSVRGLTLTNGVVRLRDEQAGTGHELRDISLETGSISPGAPVPMSGGMSFAMPEHGLEGHLDLSGELGLSEDMTQLSVPDLKITLGAKGGDLPAEGLEVKLASAVTLDQASGQLRLADLTLEGPANLKLVGNLDLKTSEDLSYTGAFSLESLSLAQLLSTMKVDLETRDKNVLQSLVGKFDLAGTATKLDVKDAKFTLDDTNLDAKLSATLGNAPKYDFSINADALDADRYLPPESKQDRSKTPGKAAKKASKGDAIAIPLMPGANGVITLGKLKVAGLTMTNIKLRLRSDANGLRLDPMSAKLYKGSYSGTLKITNKGKQPQWSATEKLSGVQIGPLLKDLTGEDRLEGTGQITMNLNGVGLDDAALRRNTKGKANFKFTDGALKGINLAQVVREVKARIRGQRVETTGPQQTDFSVLSATMNIGGGKVKNNDLTMKTPFLRVGGKGQANLVSEALDYKLTAKVVGTAKGQGGQDLSELEGIPIVVNVGGTFSEPLYQPDYEATIRAVAGKRIDEEKGKLEERARDEIQKALKGLF